MKQSVRLVRIFVASPSDVEDERRLLDEIVKELNLIWGQALSVRLELVKWETHTYSSIGKDPQAVINEQIQDDYEIFLGILWARFGRPTPRFESGTKEEFERAYTRWSKDNASVRIMFYFKDTPIAPSKIHLEQFKMVTDFRTRLEKMGLCHRFTSPEDFAKLLRVQLSRQLQDMHKTTGLLPAEQMAHNSVPNHGTQQSNEAENSEEFLDDLGFIDLLEVGLERARTVCEVLNNMTYIMDTLGSRLTQRGKEVERIRALNDPNAALRESRRVVNQGAIDMEQFAGQIEGEIPVLSDAYSGAINAFARATTMARQANPHDDKPVEDAIEAVTKLEEALARGPVAFLEFKSSVDRVPKLTATLEHAKKKVSKVLSRLKKEIERELKLTRAAKAAFRALLSVESSGPELNDKFPDE